MKPSTHLTASPQHQSQDGIASPTDSAGKSARATSVLAAWTSPNDPISEQPEDDLGEDVKSVVSARSRRTHKREGTELTSMC